MSEVMRFNMIPAGQPNPAKNGLYVRHDDYATLEAELAHAKNDLHYAKMDQHERDELRAENAKLRAELERRESHWFALVMNCAAELEIASYCMTDTEAKRVAQSGADHYRKQANAAPSAPKADEKSSAPIDDDDIAMAAKYATAIAAARQEGKKV